jgi:hypothetical protein
MMSSATKPPRGRRFEAMRRWSFFILLLAAVSAVESKEAPISGDSAKVWVGRAQEFEEVLRTGEIVDVKDLGEGRNHPRKVTLNKGGLTLKGIWKPIERGRHDWAWECYQAEVVAYKLDKLLGLTMVPPTVEKDIAGQKGSLQLWVDGGRLYKEVQDQTPQTVKWSREISRMKLFDNLICNPDRHTGNFMVDSDWNIILIDHSQCFLSRGRLHEDSEMLPTRFDRRLVKKLKEMSLEKLEIRFARLLLDSQIKGIIARRDALLEHMEKLIAEKGEKAVLF